jgi:hypothetical protein
MPILLLAECVRMSVPGMLLGVREERGPGDTVARRAHAGERTAEATREARLGGSWVCECVLLLVPCWGWGR